MTSDRSEDFATSDATASTAPVAPGEGRTPAWVPNGGADRAGREPGELSVALSPRQIFGGFVIAAGLIVWLLRRARRRG